MARKAYGGVNIPQADLEAARKAMHRAIDLEGISYASLAEFVRDALRRRVEAINGAWRQSVPTRERTSVLDHTRKKGGKE